MASTQNTDEADGWVALLSSLTDDELDRYGAIAEDQLGLEWDKRWAQLLCAVAALITGALAVREVFDGGFTRFAVVLALVTAAFAIWPLQKARMRRLWKSHCSAVAQEKQRRREERSEKTG